MGCSKYIFGFIAVFLVCAFFYEYAFENPWILVLIGPAFIVVIIYEYKRRKDSKSKQYLSQKNQTSINSKSEPVPIKATPELPKTDIVRNIEIKYPDANENTSRYKLIYSFDAILSGSNTPKRQKTILSILKETEFDILLTVKSETTSTFNYVERVKYYSDTIGNLPTDISEKVSNRWGRYTVQYKIRRLIIYANIKREYSCRVWVDVLIPNQ